MFLVNNAGITQLVPHKQNSALDDDLIDRIMQVDFRGAFNSHKNISNAKNKKTLGWLVTSKDVAEAVVAVVGKFIFSTGYIFEIDGGRPLI